MVKRSRYIILGLAILLVVFVFGVAVKGAPSAKPGDLWANLKNNFGISADATNWIPRDSSGGLYVDLPWEGWEYTPGQDACITWSTTARAVSPGCPDSAYPPAPAEPAVAGEVHYHVKIFKRTNTTLPATWDVGTEITSGDVSQLPHGEFGEKAWWIPIDLPEGHYRYKVGAHENSTYGYSGEFAVKIPSPPAPISNLTVTKPDNTAAYKRGENLPITWNYTDQGWKSPSYTGNVNINLYKENGTDLVATIGTANLADKKYSYQVPGAVSDGKYLVKIALTDYPATNASSAVFQVSGGNTNPPAPISELKVIKPSSTVAFQRNQTLPIAWTYLDQGWQGIGYSGDVNIKLYKANGTDLVAAIGAAKITAKTFSYQIPGVVSDGQYLVKVVLKDYPSTTASSVVFQVSGGNTKTINIKSPNGGEIWDRGKTYTIRWGGTGLTYDKVTIQQWNEKTGEYKNLGQQYGNYASWNWRVPPLHAKGKFKIRVIDSAGKVFDVSDTTFAIQ